MIIYVDLDGVLVDTVQEMFRRFGRGIMPKDCHGSYDTSTILGIDDPWSQFGGSFFDDAVWTEDGRDIWNVVVKRQSSQVEVRLCSSPTCEPDSAAGKLRWIRKNMPGMSRHYHLTPMKEDLAGPQAVLIDDCDLNVDAFRANGGHAILVPRPWNSKHWYQDSVPRYIDKKLDVIERHMNTLLIGEPKQ